MNATQRRSHRAFPLIILTAMLLASRGFASGAEAPDVFDVRDFGGVGDGKTLNTAAFSRAVAAAEAAGGGTVRVGPGRYLTGTIMLKSNVTLDLDAAATLLASESPDDFPLVDEVWTPGRQVRGPLIYAVDAQRVAVTGRGVIDGQGRKWWEPILAAKAKRKAGAASSPATEPVASATSPGDWQYGRPRLIRFVRCSDVVVEHVTLQNAPEWNIHPLLCERIRIDGVTIFAPVPSPNTDGINVESCRNVQISNCRVDNGDDSITLKSGLDEAGRRMGKPCEDITISNCVIYHGHGGVTIGSEMSGGVRNVTVSNCVFHGTDNGIRIKSQRGRGGVVEGVAVSNIVMQDVPHPFTITTFYAGKDKPGDVYPVDAGTPTFRDFLFSSITARGAKEAGSITGLREKPIADITFSNVHVRAEKGFTCTNADGIRFLDTRIEASQGEALIVKDCANLRTERLERITTQPASKMNEGG
ncbi:MAG TPA: glycoside hydrolase family 28 protein [Tepidisphaeraceae bacterium]|nr:glycoside hydrolase family 28 protein [Tepidisphaeraceae bacterium]